MGRAIWPGTAASTGPCSCTQIESYRYWQEQLGRDEFSYGQFGENLTVSGLADDQVCIGDRYRAGEAVFEVTQPRVTCYRVGIRMGDPRIPALLVSHHRPGFYLSSAPPRRWRPEWPPPPPGRRTRRPARRQTGRLSRSPAAA
jgi:hypothetical protein